MHRDTEPVVIFLAFANDLQPGGRYLRDLASEAEQIQKAFRPLEKNRRCQVVVCEKVTLRKIVEVFQTHRNQVAIFHFGGHAGSTELILQDSEGASRPAHAAGLADLLKGQLGLRLVFLNGCASRGHVEGIHAAGVPATLATSQVILDAVATEFATTFYQGLVHGASLKSALHDAQGIVRASRNDMPREAYAEHAGGSEVDAWPWELHFAPAHSPAIENWTLNDALKDPYFGLPELPSLELPEAPFVNLRPFTRDEAPIFFGRGWEIRRLYKALTSEEECPIVLFFGLTGVGKSSLLAAGLVPRLEAHHDVLLIRRTAVGLPTALRDALGSLQGLREGLSQRKGRRRPVLILDQVEEMWSNPLPDGKEIKDLKQILLETFGGLSRPPNARLVLSFRKEWLAEIESMLESIDLPWQKVDLLSLGHEGIDEAIQGPSAIPRFGFEVDNRLPGLIAGDLLRDPDAAIAPTLQILLARMWQEVRLDRKPYFSKKLFTKLRRNGRWLREFFEQQLGSLPEQHRGAEKSGLVLDLLHYHSRSPDTSASRPLEAILVRYRSYGQPIEDLVQACKDCYLLSDSVDSTENRISRLGHDVLAPVVRDAFDRSDRPGQRARRILGNRAQEWADGAAGPTLDEVDLGFVEEGLTGMRSLFPSEERLLEASRIALLHQKKARTRDARVKRILRNGVMVLSVAGFALAFFATMFWRTSDVRRLAAEAKTQINGQLDLSLLLNLEAYARQSSPDTLSSLATALASNPRLKTYLHGHEGFVREAIFHPTRNILASSSSDRQTLIWDFDQKRVIQLPQSARDKPKAGENSRPLSFSSDGRWLAYADEGCVRIWDIEARERVTVRLPCQFEDSRDNSKGWRVRSLAFGPGGLETRAFEAGSGAILAAAWPGRPVLLLATATGARTQTPSMIGAQSVQGLHFDPTGRFLAVGGNGEEEECSAHFREKRGEDQVVEECGCLAVIDVIEGRIAAGPSCIGNDILWDLDWDPRRNRLVTAWREHRVRTWTVQGEQLLLSEESVRHEASVNRARFSSDGRIIATASWDQSVMIWDATKLFSEQKPVVFRGHSAGIGAVAISPDASVLVSGGGDRKLALWNLDPSPRAEKAVSAHRGGVCCLAFSRDGNWLISGGSDGVIGIRDSKDLALVASAHQSGKVDGEVGKVATMSLALGDQEQILASGGSDGWTRFWNWDAQTLERREELDVSPKPGSPGANRVRTIVFNSVSRSFIIGIENGNRYTRNLNSRLDPLRFHEPQILAMDTTSDGSRVFTVGAEPWPPTSKNGKRGLLLWNGKMTGEPTLIPHPTLNPLLLRVSNDDRYIATASGSRALIFDLNRLAAEPVQLQLHSSIIRSLAFAPLDDLLAVGHSDGTIVVWDLQSRTPWAPLRTHSSGVAALAFKPDGSRLASGDNSGTVAVWNLEEALDVFEDAACDMAGRNLSREEWRGFIQRDPLSELRGYRRHCSNLPWKKDSTESAPVRKYPRAPSNPRYYQNAPKSRIRPAG